MPVDLKLRSTTQNSIGEKKKGLLSGYVHEPGRFSLLTSRNSLGSTQ